MTQMNELGWLRDAVGGRSRRSLLFVSAKPASCSSAEFWSAVSHPDLFRSIADSLAKEGRKVVLVTDTESDPARRHYLALQFARALAGKKRDVLLVDAELDGDGFSAALDEPDREGWADLVLYGASPEATVRDSPVEGIRILGAGSLRPSPGLALDVAALERGVERLRNQFATVLVVSGARRVSEAWNELLGSCDGVVLATTAATPQVREMVELLEERRVPLWGAAIFGSERQAVELTVDSQLKEKSRLIQPLDVAKQRIEDGGSSSAPFRWAAGAIALLLLTFVGWWWVAQQRTSTQPPPRVAETEEVSPAPDSTETLVAAATLSDTVEAATEIVEVADASARETPSVVQEEEPEPAPQELAEAKTPERSPPPTQVPETTEFPARNSDPLLLPPGGGWSLHPWSFPDSAEALAALLPLERDGMKPSVKGFRLEGRGRWFRVLVGRYDSREAAVEARPRLAERRGVDWVGVVRVP